MEINIPNSMLKKMLAQNGCRVAPDATEEFKEMMITWTQEISTNVTEKVTADKRKTIKASDLDLEWY